MSRDADEVELELADAMRAYDRAMRDRPRDDWKVNGLAVRLNQLRAELHAAERRQHPS